MYTADKLKHECCMRVQHDCTRVCRRDFLQEIEEERLCRHITARTNASRRKLQPP
jgi:hypothetical protein